MKSKKVPQIHFLKENRYKLDMRMIIISDFLTITKKQQSALLSCLFIFLVPKSHDSFYRTEYFWHLLSDGQDTLRTH